MSCSGCKRIVHGVAGLAKAALGLDKASEETIGHRRAICHDCDQRTRWWVCKKCDCVLEAKMRVASEECPLRKWPKERT